LNNVISKKNTIAVFLAVILIAGIIAAFTPSFIIGVNAQSEPYYRDNRYGSEQEYPSEYSDSNSYNIYEPQYGMDNYKKSSRNDNYEQPQYPSYQPDYKPEYPSYEQDNKHDYKSKKDSSSSVSINKLKCINNNVNINGNNTGDINVGNSGSSASSPGTDEGYLGVGSSGGNYGEGYDNRYKKQKDAGFTCIINNNNNNTNIVAGGGNGTDDGDNVEEPTATLAVGKVVTCNLIDVSQATEEACITIENTLSPDDFNIVVTGNEPDPDEFPGSNNQPVVVTLGAGDYEVTEELPNLPTLPAGVTVSRTTTFEGDCADVDPSDPESIVATGTIEAGESQTCTLDNLYEASTIAGGLTSSNINTDTSAFNINSLEGLASSFSSPLTITQGTEQDLSALEKTAKLKQQWIGLLP
jgi:hypothetical protein